MTITETQLDSFIALYKKVYGEKLPRNEAYKQASDLLWLVDSTFKPMTKKQAKKYGAIAKK